MANYVKFEMEDGTVVYLEATDVPRGTSGFPLAGKGDHPSEQASVSFEGALQSVRKMATVLLKELRDGLNQPPDEMQVNFGMKASAEVGSLIVSRGGAEANFNVMLRWRQKDEADKSGDKSTDKSGDKSGEKERRGKAAEGESAAEAPGKEETQA